MKTRILGVAGVLVFVSAAIHLALGTAGLVEALSTGEAALMPVLYVLGGLAALGLLAVIALTPATTTAYAAGAGLMALFVLAYADVHAFGFAESTLGVEFHDHGDHGHGHDEGHSHDHDNGHGHSHDHGGEGHSHDHGDGHGHSHDHGGEDHDHSHDGDTMTVLAEHLRDDVYALVSKGAEVTAGVLFAVLIVLDR